MSEIAFDKFKNVIAKAIVSCKNSGIDENDHFSRVGKMIDIECKAAAKKIARQEKYA